MEMQQIDQAATLDMDGVSYAGTITCGSGVILNFQPVLDVVPGVSGVVRITNLHGQLRVRTAGSGKEATQLQPSLARADRTILQSRLTRLALAGSPVH